MAKVTFRIRSKSNKNVSIKVYLSNGVNKFIETSTGFTINPKDWSNSTKLPKQHIEKNKTILRDLKILDLFILDKLNNANSNNTLIDKNWLDNTINECFNRVEKTDNTILVNHIDYILDNANTRVIKGKKDIGLSENTIKVYKTFKNIILAYQKKQLKNKVIHFSQINKKFVDDFTKWLLETKQYSKNNAGKQIEILKTICNDAEKLEIDVNPYYKNIEGFSERNEDRYIVTLNSEDLEKIYSTDIQNSSLNNAKKWILIGCELGQRCGDLLNINKSNLRLIEDILLVDLIQSKTGKYVTIPVINKRVKDILLKDIPYKISSQKLNEYIKEVCRIAGINEIIEGTKNINIKDKNNGISINRKKLGFYPKYELITSHSFRRSFATNYYKKIPTAILINITGHSKESLFLQYINQREDKDQNALLFAKYYNELSNDNLTKKISS